MRPLLAARSKHQHTAVVLLGEELQRGNVLEGMDVILLGELLGERTAEGVEVGEGILGDLGTGGAPQEEGSFGVLDGFGGFLVERTLGARIARFSGALLANCTDIKSLPERECAHLSQHDVLCIAACYAISSSNFFRWRKKSKALITSDKSLGNAADHMRATTVTLTVLS
jgi:hypothetical protein